MRRGLRGGSGPGSGWPPPEGFQLADRMPPPDSPLPPVSRNDPYFPFMPMILARPQAAIGLGLIRQCPEKAETMIDRIERESVRMDSLIGKLLTLSQLEPGVFGLMKGTLTGIATSATPENERNYGEEDGGKRSRNILAVAPRL